MNIDGAKTINTKEPEAAKPYDLDHDAALELAQLKHASNLARCYLDLHRQAETLRSLLYAAKDQLTEARALIAEYEKVKT